MDNATDLELLSPLVNQAVVRTPGRRFAGLVLQGDRLGEWVRMARSSDPEDREELRQELEDSLRELIRVSQSTGVGVPAGLPPV
ncbi:MAG TPA: hypothetical protein VGK17_07820 [Propionicimonas sp.]